MNLTIRVATKADATRITEFNALIAKETENLDLDFRRLHEGVLAVLNDPAKGTYYVAEADGAVVGQLMTTYEWSDWRNGVFWWIQSVYVQNEFREKGVFRALFEHIRTMAKQRPDVCGLRLYMDTHNARARQTYERLGMKKTAYEMFEIDFVL
jgi:GNAT superfamily N-acetyltransferase